MASPNEGNPGRRNRRTLLVLLMLMLLVVGLPVIFHAQRQLPRVVILPLQEKTPSRLQLIAEHGWSWLRFHLFGPGRSILLSATILDFKGPIAWSGLSLSEPQYSGPDGLEVWILSSGELQRVRQRLKESPGAETVSNPRIQTGSGIEGAMFVGQTVLVNGGNQVVGFRFECLPRIRSDRTDLISTLTFSELADHALIRTNLAVRSRIQIPNGSGVFLLNVGRSVTNARSIGVLISPTVQ